MASYSVIMFSLIAYRTFAETGTSRGADNVARDLRSSPNENRVTSNCDPNKAPHVSVNRSHMFGDDAPFQAWRPTEKSVDLRFYAFPVAYTEGDPWGKSCDWPVTFICVVRAVAVRPTRLEMQTEGVGPGIGRRRCTWEQASSNEYGKQHHCHVYIHHLQGHMHLENSHYHAWCMACIGHNCNESRDEMVHPRPEHYLMSTREDYQAVLDAIVDERLSLNHTVRLSDGQVIQGYHMKHVGYIRRTITGYSRPGRDWLGRAAVKKFAVMNKKNLPKWRAGLEIILDDGLPFKTREIEEESAHLHVCFEAIVACCALILYISWSMLNCQNRSFFFLCFRCKPFSPLHETGLATLLGYAIGFFKMLVVGDRLYVEFSFSIMSLLVLPIVIFAAGYNLKIKSFFAYNHYVFLYGFMGTISFFYICFKAFMWIAPEEGFATTSRGITFMFDTRTCLVLAAVLSCCDTVAPLTLIDSKKMSVLHAVVFGEAVLNDVVGVLLSAGLRKWTCVPSVLQLVGTVAYCSMSSLLIGVVGGVIISCIWARCPSLQTNKDIKQPVLLMMLVNYMSYLIAEMLEQSAIFAIFVSGIICSHYAARSMSEEAMHFASEAVEMLAYLTEALMFVYFGFASAIYLSDKDRFPISVEAIGVCVFAVVVVRMFVLTGIFSIVKVFKRWRPLSVPFSTTLVVELCGCIRGTICYALILRSVHSFEYRDAQQQLIISTVLLVVNSTTLVFGCVLPLAIKCLRDDADKPALWEDPQPSRSEGELQNSSEFVCQEHSSSTVEMGSLEGSVSNSREDVEVFEILPNEGATHKVRSRVKAKHDIVVNGIVVVKVGIGGLVERNEECNRLQRVQVLWDEAADFKCCCTGQRIKVHMSSVVKADAVERSLTRNSKEFTNCWKEIDKNVISPLLCKDRGQNVRTLASSP